MKKNELTFGLVSSCVSAGALLIGSMGTAAASQPTLDRTILPIQEPKRPFFKELDVRKAKTPTHNTIKAPEGAPNVIIILIDDLGFGATET